MSEPLLVVDTDYTVHLHGRRLALATSVQLQQTDNLMGHPKIRVSFECTEIPEFTTPPKPKRTWASAMGLKKPKGGAL
ncbi:hypothetical protein SEA_NOTHINGSPECIAL_39 [Mycobacterium phage NothingSpecial]|nr:hypothetical protein SEA_NOTHINGSPECIAL_39 [Mycobacterium phage NothingSpecial]